jgi:hypothetical protein
VLCLAAQNRRHCPQCYPAGAFGYDSVCGPEPAAVDGLLLPSACCVLPPSKVFSASLVPSPPRQSQQQPAVERVGLDISAPGYGGISVLPLRLGKTATQRSRTSTHRAIPRDTRHFPAARCGPFRLVVPSQEKPGSNTPNLISRTASPWDTCTYTARHPVLCLARRLPFETSFSCPILPPPIDAWRASCNHTFACQASSLEPPPKPSPSWIPETRRS